MIARSSEMADRIGWYEDAISRFRERYLSRLVYHFLVDFRPELPRMLQLSYTSHREEDRLI